jgi:hypothetical protein
MKIGVQKVFSEELTDDDIDNLMNLFDKSDDKDKKIDIAQFISATLSADIIENKELLFEAFTFF